MRKQEAWIAFGLVIALAPTLFSMALDEEAKKTFSFVNQPPAASLQQQDSPKVIEITLPDGTKATGFIKDSQFIRTDQVPAQVQQQTQTTTQISEPLAPKLSEFYTDYHIHYRGLFSGGKNERVKHETDSYWNERKQALEDENKGCQASSLDKMGCYLQVRQFEHQKTSDYINQVNQTLQLQTMRYQASQQAASNFSRSFQANQTIHTQSHCTPSGGDGSYNCSNW